MERLFLKAKKYKLLMNYKPFLKYNITKMKMIIKKKIKIKVIAIRMITVKMAMRMMALYALFSIHIYIYAFMHYILQINYINFRKNMFFGYF